MENEEIEEITIDMKILLTKAMELNRESTNDNCTDVERELAESNIYYLKQLEELIKELKF